MLEDAAGIRRVVLACGYVDLRKGVDGLSMIIGDKYHQNPFEKGTLFLFCGRRSDRIKGLLWMGNGFLLLYKRFESGSLSWPRTTEEAADLTEEQYHYLMLGLNPLNPKIREVSPPFHAHTCFFRRIKSIFLNLESSYTLCVQGFQRVTVIGIMPNANGPEIPFFCCFLV